MWTGSRWWTSGASRSARTIRSHSPSEPCWIGRTSAAETPTVVVNLSTSLVVEDAARAAGARFVRAPVGEANVARAIRDERAVIGGEGNGGVILPALHIGRDAPLGVALILHLLATIWGNGVASWWPRRPGTRSSRPRAARTRAPPAVRPTAGALRRSRRRERDGLRLAWRGSLAPRPPIRHRADRSPDRRSTDRRRSRSARRRRSRTLAVRFMA